MRTVEDILKAVRRLPEGERTRQIAELREGGAHEYDEPSADRRRAATKRWRARAGTGGSDFADVSNDKAKHLADIFAEER